MRFRILCLMLLCVMSATVASAMSAYVDTLSSFCTDSYGNITFSNSGYCASDWFWNSGGYIPPAPTITACTAQNPVECRTCTTLYTANGGEYSYSCGTTKSSDSCKCSNATGRGCTLEGSCTYSGW
jgi:hypothetical protein